MNDWSLQSFSEFQEIRVAMRFLNPGHYFNKSTYKCVNNLIISYSSYPWLKMQHLSSYGLNRIQYN